MEARISSEETRTSKSNPKKEAVSISSAPVSCNSTPAKRRPKTTTELRKSANNSAAAKAKEAKEKAAQQWQRRKNYDPLKSMAKAKLAAKGDNQYTDESSDVDSASASGCSFSQKSTPTNPRLTMIRSDGGRHSLRHQQHNNKDSSEQQPQSLGSSSRYQRPPFRTNVTSQQNGGRSTSSLSSREAEFQVHNLSIITFFLPLTQILLLFQKAWKRRKNYNPMRSAANAVGASMPSQSSKSSPKSTPSKAVVSKTNSAKISTELSSTSMLHKRSASFHYPDGTSRITHSVYSSEEDFNDEDEEEEEPRLYEVNEDELFLAYDSGGIVPRRRPRRTPPPPSSRNERSGAGSTSSTQSGSKLEALDNLVISTIFSVSTKLCLLSGKLVKNLQERASDKEEEAMLQTLVKHLIFIA